MSFHAMYRAAFMLLVSFLTACGGGVEVNINSHSPSNSSVIYVNGGDAVDFSVSGPTYRSYSEAAGQVGVTGQWAVYKYEPDNYGASDAFGVVSFSRAAERIESKLGSESSPFSFRFDVPTTDIPQYYVVSYTVYERLVGGTWSFADSSRSWLVYVGGNEQTPPVWEGDFFVSEAADIARLNGYSSIDGSLSILPFSVDKDVPYSIGMSNAVNITNVVEGREIRSGIPLGFINSANQITSLDSLSGLVSISGNLNVIDNAQLVSLSGFENLESIGGEALIFRNVALETIQSLSGVTHIGGDLYIDYQPELTDLQGLEGLSIINGDLSIHALAAISSLQALSGVAAVAGNLQIEGNDVLQSLSGLDNVATAGEKLLIKQNAELTNIDALNQLDSVGSNFSITSNPQLCNSAAEATLQLVQSRSGVGSDNITVSGNDDC